jgi:hypothetical protein
MPSPSSQAMPTPSSQAMPSLMPSFEPTPSLEDECLRPRVTAS